MTTTYMVHLKMTVMQPVTIIRLSAFLYRICNFNEELRDIFRISLFHKNNTVIPTTLRIYIKFCS